MTLTVDKDHIESIFSKIKYNFIDHSLLISAITHPSFINKENINYERLEFLGDSVLNLCITKYLFSKYPNENEGSLSIKRSELINKDILYQACIDLNIENYIFISPGINISDKKTMIKLLSNIYESIIGAIYLDSDYLEAFNFIKFSLLDKKKQFSIIENYKGNLLELCNKLSLSAPNYKILKSEGPDHTPKFTVELSIKGYKKIIEEGTSIKEAEQMAAKEGFKLIKSLH